MEIYKSKCAEVAYNSASDCLEFVWEGFAPSQDFREAFDSAADWLKTHRVSKWILDHQKSKIIAPEDQKWLVQEWFVSVRQEIGIPDTVALVNGEDFYGKISVTSYSQALSQDMGTEKLRLFEERTAAEDWLMVS